MESRNMNVSIWSLPGGDRRGASGADAGRYSMQTIGGEGSGRPSAGEPEQSESTRRYNLRPLTRSRSTSRAGNVLRNNRTNNDERVVRLASIEEGSHNSRIDRTEEAQEVLSSLSSPSSLFSSLSSSPPCYLNSDSETSSLSSLSPKLSAALSQPRRLSIQLAASQNSNNIPVRSAEDVSQETLVTQPATTKAGKPRVRMKWDAEINTFIMRTYYYITNLETDKTMYCKKLFDQFKIKYPSLDITSQRIADQKRAIIRNKLLSQEDINEIKKDVSEQLKREELVNSTPAQLVISSHLNQDQTNSPQNVQSLDSVHVTSLLQTQISNISDSQPSDLNSVEAPCIDQLTNKTLQDFFDKLKTTLNLYSGTDPTSRPRLPRLRENKSLYKLVHAFNYEVLGRFITSDSDLTSIHTLVYCSALVISTELGYKISIDQTIQRKQKIEKPRWQIRLENDIQKLRADIGRLTQYINNNRHENLVKKVNLIFDKYKVHSTYETENKKPEEFLDTLKQKLTLKSQRLARYKKALQRKVDNNLFNTSEKGFYRTLKNKDTNSTIEVPTEQELKNYWTNIWKKDKEHNEQAIWIKDEENNANSIEQMEFTEVSKSDIEQITRRMKNWKAAGIDGVHNFWYKKLSVFHDTLAKIISDLIKGSEELPSFVTKGITYMLPKSNNTAEPSQYRPITCLPTIYKLITSCITRKINTHIISNNVLAEEQKGCRQNHKGCKEQLIIDSTILKHATTNNRNLHLTYIDYQKAFDSVPHSWLIRVLQIYKINPDIITFLESTMSTWRTTLSIKNNATCITTDEIPIENGIFQGDSLSPLWFCLALNPLSHLLNSFNFGYKLTTNATISHLMYMDDIKLFSKSEKEMNKLIKITSEFSNDINMKFGLEKCKTLNLRRGKVTQSDICEDNPFEVMEENDTYKYLGLHQGRVINHIQIKAGIRKEYFHRLNLLCKRPLNSKNMFKAINTYAVPILTYSFGIVKWSISDLKQLEVKTRSTLTKHNYLHPKSAIERMTLDRIKGGRGLIDLTNLWLGQIQNLRNFFYSKASTSKIHLATLDSDKNFTPINLNDKDIEFKSSKDNEKDKLTRWRGKQLHGRHILDLEQPFVDLRASNGWLRFGSLFPETEGFMIAIQDQVINTRNYKKFILKSPNSQNDKCRKCHRQPETIQHITSACQSLTQTDYTHRHNQVAHIIHQKLAVKYKLIPEKLAPYYQYAPKPVLESDFFRMYFDRAILTDKTVHNNRPDITLIDKTNKITYIIDIAIPNTHNLQKTIAEKIHKYTELKEEIIRLWKMNKVLIVPLVLSSTGVIPNNLQHYLKMLDLNENIYLTMQKAAILNTCRTVRKFLQDDSNPPNIN